MPHALNERHYTGQGKQANAERDWRNLPNISPDVLTHPSGYLASPGLAAAVNVALELGMPLLLTGEPGCGKSQLAYSLAWELGFPRAKGDPWPKPLCFTVKSDTQSRDLFYNFDTLGRFRASRVESEDADAHRYLRFEALGMAILRALGPEAIEKLGLSHCLDHVPSEPQRSVVLIDEIDKAPREVPNDILNEIERMSFEIPELFAPGQARTTVSLQQDNSSARAPLRPVVIITSNRERELPEAFLRRCVYYHVELPPFRADPNQKGKARNDTGHAVTIESIIEKRLGIRIDHEQRKANAEKSVWAGCVALFRHLRSEAQMQKPPSTGELLNWMQLLRKYCRDQSALSDTETRALFSGSAVVTLFKHQEDQETAKRLIEDWLARPAS